MPDLSVFNAAGDLAVLTAAQVAAPNAEILAAVNTIYRLSVAPYTRYQSDGTALVQILAGSTSLPTDPAGLPVGTFWNNGGAVCIVT